MKEAPTAAVVVAPRVAASGAGARLNIFPGSATPAVFPAGSPFWIGYGFVPDGGTSLDETTRFELDVDGKSAEMEVELTRKGKRTVGKLAIASFESGLAVGWHRFRGRWYVAGELLLTNEAAVEFVER